MILLDYRDKRPLYEQVAERMESLIVCGALTPDTKLPSVRAMAVELSINPNTIQRAYAILEQKGFLYTLVGRGNFVAPEDTWQAQTFSALKTELQAAFQKAVNAGMTKEQILRLLDETTKKIGEDIIDD